MTKSIAILGAGWLGFPTAIQLQQKGYLVKVSTTTASKIAHFIQCKLQGYVLHLSPTVHDYHGLHDFLNADVLLINIPPGKNTAIESHADAIRSILPAIEASPIRHIIYVSATSVYHEHNQTVFETEVQHASEAANQKLALAEDLIKAIPNKHVTILRYGGLVGGTRNLLKFFEGKINVAGGHVPVNLIHQKDAVNILCETITQQRYDNTFNVCTPLHPTKKEFYTDLANRFHAIAPQFLRDDQTPFKIVNADKIIKALDYKFVFEDPLKFEYDE
jgi:nucleoside-diphosphate-sugar epimerase